MKLTGWTCEWEQGKCECVHLRNNNNLWNSALGRGNKHTPLPDLLEKLHERLLMQISVFHFSFHNAHVCSIRDISREGYSFLRFLT